MLPIDSHIIEYKISLIFYQGYDVFINNKNIKNTGEVLMFLEFSKTINATKFNLRYFLKFWNIKVTLSSIYFIKITKIKCTLS